MGFTSVLGQGQDHQEVGQGLVDQGLDQDHSGKSFYSFLKSTYVNSVIYRIFTYAQMSFSNHTFSGDHSFQLPS